MRLGRRTYNKPEEGEQILKVCAVIMSCKKFVLMSIACIQVAKIIEHPRFDSTNLNLDFALLRLEHEATITSTVRTVCLPPNANEDYENVKVIVVGWGSLNATVLKRPETLQVYHVATNGAPYIHIVFRK